MKTKYLISTIFTIAMLASPALAYADYVIDGAPDVNQIGAIKGGTGTLESRAQQFTTLGSGSFTSLLYMVATNGSSPIDNIEVEIFLDGGSGPTGSAIATSMPIAGNTLQQNFLSPVSTDFTFASPVSVSAATTYDIVVIRTGSRNTSAYYVTGGDSGSAPVGSIAFFNSSGTWNSTSDWDNFSVAIATPSTGSTMDTLVSDATSTFAGVAGFDLSDVGNWMWNVLLSPILSGALALLVALRFYAIALALISIFVFFAFKAWHMWRGK